MLKRTSRFVLEVLPYVLTALIAAVVVPGYLCSQAFGPKAAATLNVPGGANVLETISHGHSVFASRHVLFDSSVKTASDKLAYR
jgi:hypothetical protein